MVMDLTTPDMVDWMNWMDEDEKSVDVIEHRDLTISQFAALAGGEEVEGDIYEVTDRENLPDVLKEWVVVLDFEKGRVYIDDPSEAPEDAEVHEGEQGGLYYVTGDEEPEEDGDSAGEDGEGPVVPEDFDSTDAVRMVSDLENQFGERIAHTTARLLIDYIPEIAGQISVVLDATILSEKQEEDFQRQDVVRVENVHEAPSNVVIHCHDDFGLYYVDRREKNVAKQVSGEIVRAERSDVERVFEIEKQCFASPRGINTLREAVTKPDWGLFVVKHGSEIVGHTLIVGKEITAVAVDPEYRGKGYGKGLVERAVAFAEQRSDSAQLKVRVGNDVAISLYEDFGFEAEKRIADFYSDGEDAYLMEKESASDRVYIESPTEAPEGVEVHEGDQGGLWYDPSEEEEGEEDRLKPEDRQAEIGDNSVHPVMWRRPEPDELGKYISEMQETDFWEDGHETFDDAFFGDKNTENEYTDEDGDWDEERLEKHKEWGENLVNEDAATDEGEQPVGVILLGSPGSGKGWWQEQVAEGEYEGDFGGRDFTQISSDRTKEPIPEYTGENAAEVHDEASKVAKDNLAPTAFENEHNVIVDKVANSPDKTLEMVEQMEEAGYDLRAAFVDVPPEKSVHNVTVRYEEEGRFTPLDFTANARGNSYDSFTTVVDEFDIPDEKVGVFDNDVEWGDAPDTKFMGDELLKFIGLFFEESNAKRFININHLDSNNGRQTGRRRDEHRDSRVAGRRLHRSSDRSSQRNQRERPVIVNLTKADWVPYQGPQGGEGWQSVESGEVVYDEEPPGNTEADPEDYHGADEGDLISALEEVTGQQPSEELEQMSADEIREAIQELASPEELAAVMEELSGSSDGPMDVLEEDQMVRLDATMNITGREIDLSEEPIEVTDVDHEYDAVVIYHPEYGSNVLRAEDIEGVEVEQEADDEYESPEEAVDSFDVDWTDGDERQLSEDQQENIRSGIERVYGPRAADVAYSIIDQYKEDSTGKRGARLESAMVQALDLDGEAYRLDNIDEELEFSENELAAFGALREASQRYVEEQYGGSIPVHRGVNEDAVQEILNEVGDDESVTIDMSAVAATSTDRDLAEQFAIGRRSATISWGESADDVVLALDAITSQGGHQDEFLTNGDSTEVLTDNIILYADAEEGYTEVPLSDWQENPQEYPEISAMMEE